MDSLFSLTSATAGSGWAPASFGQRAAETLSSSPLVAAAWALGGLVFVGALMSALGMVLIYGERKVAAHFQCRLGPMRVGWHGVLQPVADTLKLLTKEDIVPAGADRFLFFAAPFFCILATVLALAVLPVSPTLQVLDLNIGILYVVAVTGFGVLGVLLGGWSSNNKWSMLGAMRAGAQIVSYEISAVLALLVIVLLAGSMRLSDIVLSQQAGWWIWRAPGIGLVAFLIFLVASVAETNRTPFDLAEGESELTAGFHTEYSGMRFAMFFLAEFVNMFISSALAATLFLGGWMPFHIGNWEPFNGVMDLLPPAVWFFGKSAFLVFVMMWFRWTFPRLRIDQLMRLEWKILLPIGLINLFLAAVAVVARLYFFPEA